MRSNQHHYDRPYKIITEWADVPLLADERRWLTTNLSEAPRAIFFYILNKRLHENITDGPVAISLKEMMDCLGYSRSGIAGGLWKLTEMELINQVRTPGKVSQYTINWNWKCPYKNYSTYTPNAGRIYNKRRNQILGISSSPDKERELYNHPEGDYKKSSSLREIEERIREREDEIITPIKKILLLRAERAEERQEKRNAQRNCVGVLEDWKHEVAVGRSFTSANARANYISPREFKGKLWTQARERLVYGY